jgi:hypothetical protein
MVWRNTKDLASRSLFQVIDGAMWEVLYKLLKLVLVE